MVSLAIYGLVRIYLGTLRKTYSHCLAYRQRYVRDEGMLISFWHNQLLAMPYLYFGKPFRISTLVSLSKDGELTTHILRRWGIGTVRGSSTRGGISALKELLRLAKNPHHHLVLTPDGPKGPPFQIKDGLLVLAQKSGRPIIPLAVSFQRYVQLNSWDGFLIPLPFTKAYFVCGDPVHITEVLDEEGMEEARKRMTKSLQDLNALALSMRTPKRGS
ncbi:MAG: lysophospholipid acyltransferase family protein [Nitrospirae bacterium]|nr:lysophospholipid acyltransferase family protein [Nitrospirota bacterium]MCL5284717.1 lysophospholipid acyltransferase family protein [Nitrospirota bacterium]